MALTFVAYTPSDPVMDRLINERCHHCGVQGDRTVSAQPARDHDAINYHVHCRYCGTRTTEAFSSLDIARGTWR